MYKRQDRDEVMKNMTRKSVQKRAKNKGEDPRKLRDKYQRVRAKTVGFRVSPEEDEMINAAVAISGLPKQEYCYRRCINMDVIVKGNPRVYKGLKDTMENILAQLKRVISVDEVTPEMLEVIRLVAKVMEGMQSEALHESEKK